MYGWTFRVLIVALLVVAIQTEEAPAVPTSHGPDGLVVNPTTNRIYIRTSVDILTVIDGSTNLVIDAVPVDSNRTGGIGVNALTNLVYVGNFDSQSVSVIDGASNKVIKTIPIGRRPFDVAGNPRTNRIYIATRTDDNQISVVVIDGRTHGIVTIIPRVGYHVAVNPVTNRR